MDTLPTEILIQIFTYCTLYNSVLPTTLASISSQFHSIVYTSPGIWMLLSNSRFAVYDRQRWEDQVSAYISHSYPLQMDIDVTCHGKKEMVLPLLVPLWKEWRRWKDVKVDGYRLDVGTTNRLSTLHITIEHDGMPWIWVPEDRSERDDEDDDEEEQVPSITMEISNFPYYEKLCGPLPFTILSIKDDSDEANTAKLVSLLTSCPNLSTFSYVGPNPTPDDLPDHSHTPPLLLSQLTDLRISRTYLARPILSSLALPSLQFLSLDSLNVEAELPTSIIEPGDSDDEADDFSRSPSSDRMTGVGLLRLIEHSPGGLKGLKELRMDFTDIRTRDFRVVFHELEGLEAFTIVGSDMSDSVIGFLGVHSSVAGGSSSGDGSGRDDDIEEVDKVEEDGSEGGDDSDDVRHRKEEGRESTSGPENEIGEGINGEDQHASIWLPNLITLQLIGCPQASGSILVSTLINRFHFTQTHPNKYKTIERLAIIECDQFTDAHAHELRGVLTESRFRMVPW